MAIVIQKYGGSSVATPDKIRSVANRIRATKDAGHDVVVVVSAMGDTTDQLIGLANAVSLHPPRRELDMLVTVGERISMALLSMALHDLGYDAVSFTGSQSGIITTNDHTNARIIRVTPYRIQGALERGKIVIVAGFQGVSETKEITSLGRGGSDTTAVALAAALNADYAEICSDVDGVYSTDPRVVSEAVHLDELSYQEMQSFSDAGAKVLHAEAVEWARSKGIEIRCASTHTDGKVFTRILDLPGAPRITGVTLNAEIFVLEPRLLDDSVSMDETLEILGQWNVEGVRAVEVGNRWQVVCSVQHVQGVVELEQALSTAKVSVNRSLSQVTAVGRSLSSMSRAIEQLSATLSAAGVSYQGRVVEPNGVGFLVTKQEASVAVAALHQIFIEQRG